MNAPETVALSACDITRPVPVDPVGDANLRALQDEWRTHARYQITLSDDGDWNKTRVVAEWLPYEEAQRLCDQLDRRLLVVQGGRRRWAEAAYHLQLHVPGVKKGADAVTGDLLLHEINEWSRMLPSGCQTGRRYLLPAEVLSTAPGAPLVYRDRTGVHSTAPIHPLVISGADVDVPALLARVRHDERERGHWAGEFVSLGSFQAHLVRFQRLKAAVYPIETAA